MESFERIGEVENFSNIYALGCEQPSLGEGIWLAPTAAVIGRVQLGDNVSVWFGAVIRADDEVVRIAQGSNIQDGAVLHADPGFPLEIGRNVTVGHRAILHGCKLGDNVLVGMGACVMNGVVVGSNCIIGAGALLTEGKQYPAGALILGSPAKAIRQLDRETVTALPAGAEAYARKARHYSDELASATRA